MYILHPFILCDVCFYSPVGDLRLLGGPQPNVGLLEMWFNGEWLAPCSTVWNTQAAEIACAELGFAGLSSWFSTNSETFDISGPSGRTGLVSVGCSSPAERLINCALNFNGAGNACQPNDRVVLVCEGESTMRYISIIFQLTWTLVHTLCTVYVCKHRQHTQTHLTHQIPFKLTYIHTYCI